MVRRLSADDLPQLLQILDGLPGAEKGWQSHITPSWIEDELQKAEGLGLFQPELVAFLFYRQMPEAKEVSFLMTKTSLRGKGYMQNLVGELKGRIWLEVHENNAKARDFYGKQGFSQVGRRPRYYRDGSASILLELIR